MDNIIYASWRLSSELITYIIEVWNVHFAKDNNDGALWVTMTVHYG
jgi:hypothetical protein